MVLGLRFPKQFSLASDYIPSEVATSFGMITDHVGGSVYNSLPGYSLILLAPARYSHVRKVVFHISVRMYFLVSTTARLRVAACSSSPTSIVSSPMTISSGSVRSLQDGTLPWTILFNAPQLFTKVGATSLAPLPISGDAITGPTTVLSLEFDRFSSDSVDFFAFWDSIAGADEDKYLAFRLVIERTDGSTAVAAATYAEFGATVVQAPGVGNKTCTIIPITPGKEFHLTATVGSYGNYLAALFRYIAGNWDHITKATILGYNYYNNIGDPVRTWKVGLHSITGYEPTARTLLYEESFATAQRAFFFRTGDVKDFLVDGADHTGLINATAPSGLMVPLLWLEIIQDGFELTECHHGPSALRYNISVTRYGSPGTPLFDPTWYQSFPSDRILSNTRHLGFSHADIAVATKVGISIDANLTSDIINLEVSSPTIQKVNGDLLGSTPQASVGTKFSYAPITSNDPINLAGKRKLVFATYDGSPGTNERAGTARLIYALRVPLSEIPEYGPLFPLGEFNPEGCASTAAGLGDPGLLVLTNGSTLPKKFNPEANTIEDAGVPAPFCDEVAPTSEVDDAAASPLGGLGAGIYRYRYTFRNCCTHKESDPNDADIVVDTTGASPAATVTLNFTDVRIPGDPQICEICILPGDGEGRLLRSRRDQLVPGRPGRCGAQLPRGSAEPPERADAVRADRGGLPQPAVRDGRHP